MYYPDVESGQRVYSNNSDTPRYKIMTTLWSNFMLELVCCAEPGMINRKMALQLLYLLLVLFDFFLCFLVFFLYLPPLGELNP